MRARRWGGCPSVSPLTHEAFRLGSTVARLKLKGIDGGPHKRWSMWFNSTQRAEPYQPLTSRSRTPETEFFSSAGPETGAAWLSSAVGLSPATSATPVLSCYHSVEHSKETAGDKPRGRWG